MDLDWELSPLLLTDVAQFDGRMLAADVKTISHARAAVWGSSLIDPALMRAPIMVILFIFVWGVNILVLEQARVPYTRCLLVKSVPTAPIFALGVVLLVVYAFIITVTTNFLQLGLESGIFIFYTVVGIMLVTPYVPGSSDRYHILKITKQILFATNVAFPEILLADIFCSLSKVFKDIGITYLAVYASFADESIASYHFSGMILLAIAATLPFALRVRQCLCQVYAAADIYGRIPPLLNTCKYLTGFPTVWLAAAASIGYYNSNIVALSAACALLNSVVSFAWDIIMDWGLLSIHWTGRGDGYNSVANSPTKLVRSESAGAILSLATTPRKAINNTNSGFGSQMEIQCFGCFSFHFRSKCYYSPVFYVLAVFINLALRFSWTISRFTYFQHWHPSHIVLLLEVGEIVRRGLWNCIRIEWETIAKAPKYTKEDEVDLGEHIVEDATTTRGISF